MTPDGRQGPPPGCQRRRPSGPEQPLPELFSEACSPCRAAIRDRPPSPSSHGTRSTRRWVPTARRSSRHNPTCPTSPTVAASSRGPTLSPRRYAPLLLGNRRPELGPNPCRQPRACPDRWQRLGERGLQLFLAAPPPSVPDQTQSRCPVGDVPWSGTGPTLQGDRENPTDGARRRGLIGRHDVHYPASERVRVDPLDRQTLKAKQTRGVRHQIVLNMLNERTLEQARDLTL